jgi:hypothetical protein
MTPSSNPPANRTTANRPPVNKQRSLTKGKRRSSATLWTWGAVGLVIVVVLAIVLVDVVGGSSPSQSSNFPAPSPIVLSEVTNIPASVYNTIGVTSPTVSVGGFTPYAGQPKLTFTSGGKTLPGFVYWGAEYCPYCAATRWAIVAALSRFGTLHGLGYMKSSSTDVYPDTNTFTFLHATYTSKYLAFRGYEVENRNEQPLEKTPAQVTSIVSEYNSGESFPFLDIGNAVFLISAPYNPQVLQGESWSQIAAGLSDPTNYATQAIVATANYISASICRMTNDQPGSVCDSPGVEAANTALKHSS